MHRCYTSSVRDLSVLSPKSPREALERTFWGSVGRAVGFPLERSVRPEWFPEVPGRSGFLPSREVSCLTLALFSCRHRLRWHSFQSSHRPSLNSVSLQINCQSVAQMNLLQKYSLLKLTALLEKYTPSNKHGFSW